MATYTRTVQIRWTGLNRLRAMLDPAGNRQALQRGLTNVAVDVEHRAKDNAPVKTSRLSRSIRVYGRQVGNTRVIVAGRGGVKYAAAQEVGAGLYGPKGAKYPIRPRTAKYLVFPSQRALTSRKGSRAKLGLTLSGRVKSSTQRRYGSAAMVFTKLVMHPGFKGTHYMKRAIEESPMADIMARTLVSFWRSR